MAVLNTDALTQTFTGKIILPNDPEYAVASSSMMRTGTPQLIVLPHTSQDVVAAIKFAKDNTLVISVRSGGHSGAGWSTNDGGIIIDLSAFNSIDVLDDETGFVRIGTGARWEEVALALEPFGLAISSGDTKSVGVGGLTLGGGIGWMVRKYGLAIDSLVAAEVVTAQGEIIRTSAESHPDLFWAIRGGGGNFGVVVNFEFKAHKVAGVTAGSIQYGLDQLSQVLTGWRDAMRQAPRELTTSLLLLPQMGENPGAIIIMCCFASPDQAVANSALEPLLNLGTVLKQDISVKPYAKILEEAHPPAGMRVVSKNAFVPQISDDLIMALTQFHTKHPQNFVLLRHLAGAFSEVSPDATAFAHRQSEALIIVPFFLPAQATPQDIQTSLQPWKILEPFTKGSYVNFQSERDSKSIEEAYPSKTLARLAEIKRTYDPENIFNQNYNISPRFNP
jgi:hypothetical protein